MQVIHKCEMLQIGRQKTDLQFTLSLSRFSLQLKASCSSFLLSKKIEMLWKMPFLFFVTIRSQISYSAQFRILDPLKPGFSIQHSSEYYTNPFKSEFFGIYTKLCFALRSFKQTLGYCLRKRKTLTGGRMTKSQLHLSVT